ncbi:MAG: T9SS type A sorting domain-containing protein [bacterium]|nr:T9SS type A sorting domain-containing protein [bacterium]
MRTTRFTFILVSLVTLAPFFINAQNNSAARNWNNLILEAIRNDYARPTVHARNLYHHSIICYDAWAAYDPSKSTYYLGKTHYGFTMPFSGIAIPGNVEQARTEAICYASYRFIENRYSNSPDYSATLALANQLMNQYGYDPSFTSTDYVNDGAAAFGNYLAEQIQLYGLTDGSNEINDFDNTFYTQLNPPLEMSTAGNPDIQDPNHWQPLSLDILIDQSGNLITTTQPHLSPEWGSVNPFALDTAAAQEITRDGMTFKVYFDTMQPAFLTVGDSSAWDSFYKWNHTLVSVWQSHLDPDDGVLWDISPASIGNNLWYPDPNDSTAYTSFYDLVNGGDPGVGHAVNPVTGMPYTPQIVPRADYARVLAEFWADGIDSETPPGHWYEIYHYVTDQPTFVRQWKGVGPVLDPLEYDVKAQLALGGTLHDAAIAAWSLKGYYDYLRPVSAIRYMADQGQSSDTNELNYDPNGIPLMPGFVEVVQIGDTLAGQWNENVGKIKLFTWKGHEYINNPQVDVAGVGWILAEEWWPYQRPTFVTPPFAGFVSGHSTFSRAAAHTMEFMTGSAYFPGGMGEFLAPMNEFLQFEEGPSDTIVLQWATYMDASDQCSLSRIWGGIHPPIDDIPGRHIGDVVGPQASLHADSIFSINEAALTFAATTDSLITRTDMGTTFELNFGFSVPMDTSVVPNLTFITPTLGTAVAQQGYYWIDSTELVIIMDALTSSIEIWDTDLALDNLTTGNAINLPSYTFKNLFLVDTKSPLVSNYQSNLAILNDPSTAQSLSIDLFFDEPCDTSIAPTIQFSGTNYLNPTLTLQGSSSWQNDTTYLAIFSIDDFDETVDAITMSVQTGTDTQGNLMDSVGLAASFEIDTENPTIISAVSTEALISQEDLASPQFTVDITFDEAMDTVLVPVLNFFDQGSPYTSLLQNMSQTIWLDEFTLQAEFFVFSNTNNLISLDLQVSNNTDEAGNLPVDSLVSNVLWSDMKSPEVVSILPNETIVSDSLLGSTEYYVDVTFDEPLDTSVVPLVNHIAGQPINGSIQYNVPQSYFIDSMTYRARFQVIDENIEVSPIDIEVSFAEDGSGNVMSIYSENGLISLDTKNPQIIGLYANTSVINEWGQPWEVIAVYDEPMRASQMPDVQLSAIPVNFPMVSSNWVNATSFEVIYELLGVPSQTTLVDVTLETAKDLAGNDQLTYSELEFLEIQPLLGLNELSSESIILYPNPATEGSILTLQGLETGDNTIEVRCINAVGQQMPPIVMTKQNNQFISERIHLSAGWYMLSYGSANYKLLVR